MEFYLGKSKQEDEELVKRAAAIISQLDGLDYATAWKLLEWCQDRLERTTIQSNQILA